MSIQWQGAVAARQRTGSAARGAPSAGISRASRLSAMTDARPSAPPFPAGTPTPGASAASPAPSAADVPVRCIPAGAPPPARADEARRTTPTAAKFPAACRPDHPAGTAAQAADGEAVIVSGSPPPGRGGAAPHPPTPATGGKALLRRSRRFGSGFPRPNPQFPPEAGQASADYPPEAENGAAA